MPFDFKKKDKIFYYPKEKAEIIDIPTMNFITIKGMGDPNKVDGEYKEAVSKLYALAYTIRMSERNNHMIKDFFTFVVPPLEGYWWQDGIKGVDPTQKENFQWIMMIRMPEYVTEEVFQWAQAEAKAKKNIDCSKVKLEVITEGLTVQIMHIGPYDDEARSVEIMDAFAKDNGYELDFSDHRYHHEIYLSDPRKTQADKLKTVLRHPIK